jgi:hypothetical protein
VLEQAVRMIVKALKVFLEAMRLIAENVRVTVEAMRLLAESLYEMEGTCRESACRGRESDYRGLF